MVFSLVLAKHPSVLIHVLRVLDSHPLPIASDPAPKPHQECPGDPEPHASSCETLQRRFQVRRRYVLLHILSPKTWHNLVELLQCCRNHDDIGCISVIFPSTFQGVEDKMLFSWNGGTPPPLSAGDPGRQWLDAIITMASQVGFPPLLRITAIQGKCFF